MIHIQLKPFSKGEGIDRMQVTCRISADQLRPDSFLFRAQIETVTIPGCIPQNLTVEDDKGLLHLETEKTSQYPIVFLDYKADREAEGEIRICYDVFPRILKDTDICGPYFDLRNEEGGFSSSGYSFLPVLPLLNEKEEASLCWDLSAMPDGSRAVNTFGEGDINGRSLEDLRTSYYMAGAIKSVEKKETGVYWLSEPSFAIGELADYISSLLVKMQDFFEDRDPVYRVFVRKDPFKTSGGTAMRRSYMFGWNETEQVSLESKQFILAHEMVHNWPHLNDNPYGITTWYSEGTAEFYSVMLPLRNRMIQAETAGREIEKRVDAYYANPTRYMENMEAAKICWSDRRAQRLAYGRGFLFLANVDAQIRRATGYEKSLDDVVLSILRLDRSGITLGNEIFLEEVKKLSGLDVREAWMAMCSGADVIPDPDVFDSLFSVSEKMIEEAGSDKKVRSFTFSVR